MHTSATKRYVVAIVMSLTIFAVERKLFSFAGVACLDVSDQVGKIEDVDIVKDWWGCARGRVGVDVVVSRPHGVQ